MRSLAGLAAAIGASLALAAGPARSAPPSPTPPSAGPSDEAKTITDVRCVIVAGSLSQSDDPDLQKLGTTSLLYFWGRLEGRGATANLDARIINEAGKMSADDMKAQAQTCAAMVSAAGEGLQDLSAALKQRLGAAAPAK